MANHPTKKGDSFSYKGRVLTAFAFHGRDGVYYDTYEECKKNFPKDPLVIVVPSETNGGIDVLNTTKL